MDQHALHERIMYESLRQRILAGNVESQRLLIPETIECSPVESAAVLESTDLFTEMGFDVQDFGGTTLLVNSCPVLIPRGGLVRIIRDFAEKLVQADGKMARRDLLDSMLHTMSCRAAIKAGQRLTIEEMRDLLRATTPRQRLTPLPTRPSHITHNQPTFPRPTIRPPRLISQPTKFQPPQKKFRQENSNQRQSSLLALLLGKSPAITHPHTILLTQCYH
ncbi:MAG UNVERIFIED_CONTAM: hypothetical protein LVR18_32980 [Planctomycetaceae bacterium]